MQTPADLAEVEPSLEELLDTLPMAACVITADLTITLWNQTLADWTGLPREAAVGSNLGTHAPDLRSRRFLQRVMDVFDLGTPALFSSAVHKRFLPVCCRHGSGEELMVQQTLVRLLPGDSRLALVTIQDVTSEYEQLQALRHERTQLARLHAKLRQQNEKLADLATTDELTGVKNRRRFREDFELHVALAVRQRLPLSLVMLDVDHFKQYNDTFGHPAGDEALRNVAKVLRGGIRQHDIVARYGGEEFVMLLPATNSAMALEVTRRLRAKIELDSGSAQPLTASFGVATAEGEFRDVGILVEQADQALYCAKRSGRNRVCHFRDAVLQAASLLSFDSPFENRIPGPSA